MTQFSEVTKLRRKVLTEISRMTFAGTLDKDVFDILYSVVTEDGPRYRCCVHKERAVLKDRVNVALSQPVGTYLTTAARNALAGEKADLPIINVLPEACDRCPIDKFLVTDACRNCIAHNCIASCPKKAIMVVQNRAYIDKTKCVECGLCKRSCSYGAIIEISRPCERACDLNAITADNDRRAKIDYNKCVQCGACKVACPYGAISDRSDLVQLIQTIKGGKRVYAVLAPAFIGQFGPKVKAEQLFAALRKLGFHDVKEASFGADIVTLEETKEFVSTVPGERNFLTTSCCPAFVDMVEKHLPEMAGNVSTTVSPMMATGKVIKEKDAEAVVVFIGPCIAKKAEAQKYPGIIDYTLTFEELAAMMVGADVNVSEMEADVRTSEASKDGNDFARAGGVTQAVIDTATAMRPDVELKPHRCEGLANCKAALAQIKAGTIDANFFEGMACVGGCVGGPGALADLRVTGKLVQNYAAAAKVVSPPENEAAVEEGKQGHHWHRG